MDVRQQVDFYNWLLQSPIPELRLDQYRQLNYDEIEPNGDITGNLGFNIIKMSKDMLRTIERGYDSIEGKVAAAGNYGELAGLPTVEYLRSLRLSDKTGIFTSIAELVNTGTIDIKSVDQLIFYDQPVASSIFNKVVSRAGNFYVLKPNLSPQVTAYLQDIANEAALIGAYITYTMGGSLREYDYNRLPVEYKRLFVKYGDDYVRNKSPVGDQMIAQLKAQYNL